MTYETLEKVIFSDPPQQCLSELPVEGSLPDYVHGCFYLNGPARFRIGEQTRTHWLDGDGLVRGLTLSPGRAEFRARYVNSRKFREETEAGRPLFRCFGHAFQGDALRRGLTLETPANVSVYPFGGRLLAFGEQSLPWELDPNSLETLGECRFHNRVPEITPFSAHPKFDGDRGLMCNFGIRYFGGRGTLIYYEIDESLRLLRNRTSPLLGGNTIHDFVLSDREACFHLGPYSVDIGKFVKQGVSLLDALVWRSDRESQLLILSRKTGSAVAHIPLGRADYCLHGINAHRKGRDLVVDLITAPRPFFDQYNAKPYLFEDIQPNAVVRITVDSRQWQLRAYEEMAQGIHFDFPSIPPARTGRAYPCFWALGMPASPAPAPKFYDRLLRFDWGSRRFSDEFRAVPGQYLAGEPQFIGHPRNDREGVVVCQLLAPRHGVSSYALFDAFKLSAGPLATVPLPFCDTPGFHTSFRRT